MADGISIPSQFEFKELLSHTFPGFFSAISIFMVMDLWTDKDLTTWVIGGNFAGLVSFIGFVLLMGTIMGVIIDGIHHSIIEDDIFDNLKTVQEIKSVLKTRYKKICNTENTYLTRHYFYPFIGEEKKGDKAIAIDEHLEKGYYRYSEFYANIFLSLVLFSLISPFYLSHVLEFDWSYSIIVGIISLSVACICLNSSYTAYRAYMRAQMSVICGFINRCATNECSTNKNCNVKIPLKDGFIESLIINLTIYFIILFIFYIISDNDIEVLIPGSVFGFLIVALISIILNDYIYERKVEKYTYEDIEKISDGKKRIEILTKDLWFDLAKYCIKKAKEEYKVSDIVEIHTNPASKTLDINIKKYPATPDFNIARKVNTFRDVLSTNALGAIISSIIALFSILFISLFISLTLSAPFTPIDVDPQIIALNLTYEEVSQGYIKTLSINNTGQYPINLALKCNGTLEDLIKIPEEFPYNGTEKNFTILANEKRFIGITIKNNTSIYGNYKGEIYIMYANNETKIGTVTVDIMVTAPTKNECDIVGLFEIK